MRQVMGGRLCAIASRLRWGRSGGAMVLGKLPVPGRPTIWMILGQGPIALAVGASGGCLDILILLYPFSPLSPSLWEAARYGLKYSLEEPLNLKQPTNQPVYDKKKRIEASGIEIRMRSACIAGQR